VRRAAENGVGLFTLANFDANDRGTPGLVFGYGAIARAEIDEGMRRVHDALQGIG